MTKAKKPAVIHFGLDYLKFNFYEPYESTDFAKKFISVSANSIGKEIWWFDFMFICEYKNSKGDDAIQFWHEGVNVFQLKRINDKNRKGLPIAYTVDFYSAFFRFTQLYYFYNSFLKKHGASISLSRVDIALDLVCNVQQVLDAGFTTNLGVTDTYKKNTKTGIPESYYIGESNYKNRRYFIRIYNKKKEAFKNGKYALYKDYFQFDDVTRLEVEIRSQTCRELEITLEDVADLRNIEPLKEIFTSLCICDRKTNLSILNGLGLKTKKIRKLKPREEAKKMSEENKIKRVIGGGYNLYEAGVKNMICIFLYGLREKGAYQNREELHELQENINNLIEE